METNQNQIKHQKRRKAKNIFARKLTTRLPPSPLRHGYLLLI